MNKEQIVLSKNEYMTKMLLMNSWTVWEENRQNYDLGTGDDTLYVADILLKPLTYGIIDKKQYEEYQKEIFSYMEKYDGEYTYEELDNKIQNLNTIYKKLCNENFKPNEPKIKRNKDLMKIITEAIYDGLGWFGNNETEEKQMYLMVDNVYFPIFEAEIVEEDDGTLNLRINGGDGSVTEPPKDLYSS